MEEEKAVENIYPWHAAFLCDRCQRVYRLSGQINCCPDCGCHDSKTVSVRELISTTKKDTPWWIRWLIGSYVDEFIGYRELPRKPRGLAPRMNWQNYFRKHLTKTIYDSIFYM